ncbi:CYTOCHROME P450 FAMILY 78 PROTEIN [Salix koriyanagi]|uniref:CYTOCHROME P450 FAMILY 78 PROTEIN n=1 Tax=Salix koriyanagi TaxID=2511006 RepID=A0A9Q0UP66_9ROSI|nr:CYTOCHROME P450 FAMILY 78 PROTEIN [Salix koriyanagi]
MELDLAAKDTSWWVLTLPAFLGSESLLDGYVLLSLALAFVSLTFLTWAFAVGGTAWKNGRNRRGHRFIPGPRGLPVFGNLFTLSRGLAHRTLASMAWSGGNTQLMALSLGSTPVVVASDPHTAREILTSPYFADRPIKQSAKSFMFSRAIGFAPNGTYWRLLRRIASTHLFSPRRILAHESIRQLECSPELEDLRDMVREGFELLGAFNWGDYLTWLDYFYDPFRIQKRCLKLVSRVRKLVKGIIEEHRLGKPSKVGDDCDFVDVLLSLDGEEKLQDDDMVAVLWEMIFRGTDTAALLTEWVMAELVLHPEVQEKLQRELDMAVKDRRLSELTDSDVSKLPYLQAVVKEALRVHPPGPLLSWARLCSSDVQLSNGMVIPADTTAMVNMWAITHDPNVWEDPLEFKPERFIEADVDVRGGDLSLAPFGAGRRVCPGKNLGLATVTLWVAKLVSHFKWVPDVEHPVDLSEVLKLSCEMKHPLHAVALQKKN